MVDVSHVWHLWHSWWNASEWSTSTGLLCPGSEVRVGSHVIVMAVRDTIEIIAQSLDVGLDVVSIG